MNENTSQRVPFGRPSCKRYIALLTQSGTDAPVATVLENTLGDIAWTYSTVGVYVGTLAGAFPADKVLCFVGGLASAAADRTGRCVRTDADTITLTTSENTAAANALLIGDPIEIRVYD